MFNPSNALIKAMLVTSGIAMTSYDGTSGSTVGKKQTRALLYYMLLVSIRTAVSTVLYQVVHRVLVPCLRGDAHRNTVCRVSDRFAESCNTG